MFRGDEELFTKAELAVRFKVTKAAVEKWARHGRLEIVRTPGGAPRYRIPVSVTTTPDEGEDVCS